MFDSLSYFLSSFHFLQPQWLLALIPLALIYWFAVHRSSANSDWDKVIAPHLLSVLVSKGDNKITQSFSFLLMLAWLIGVIALANPAWNKQTVPVFQTNMARVIVLDLSRSMNIADVKPSRLARAKFKIKDILARQEEGQTGLVVFAGDAFIVTPLTRDSDTINSLLSALETHIMPVQGSRADLGLLKAQGLLQQAGVAKGQVLLMADGARKATALLAAEELRGNGYPVSVLSIGTDEDGAIPNTGRQKPVIVPVEAALLRQIAEAGGGRYSALTPNHADIERLVVSGSSSGTIKKENDLSRDGDVNSDEWTAEGPLLVLLLLPLAALAFRRGWLLNIVGTSCVVIALGQPQAAMAFSWGDLWSRQDQQADKALQKGDYEQAQVLAEDPLRRGSAAFKKGDYEQALRDFSSAEGAEAAYNKGNALAQLKKYEDAIKAYDEALKQQPDMKDAINNKGIAQSWLKQQEKKQPNQKNENESDKDKNKDQQNNEPQEGGGEDKQGGGEDKQGEEGQEKEAGEKQGSENKEQGKESAEPSDQKSKEASEENQFAKANEAKDKGLKEDEEGDDRKVAPADEKNKDSAEEKEAHQAAQSKDGKGADEGAEQADPTAQTDKEKKQLQQAQAEALSKEEKIAAEQWLRRIEDDPGELLKRKFKYQYKRRRQSAGSGDDVPW